jgi:hypothetical protein
MKWYAFTGVIDGDHYHAVLQAGGLSAAAALFTENVFQQLAEEYDLSINAIYDQFSAPWIVACTRTETKPERLYIS